MKNIFFNRVERRALVFSEHLKCRRNRELSADEVAKSDTVLRSHPAVVAISEIHGGDGDTE